MELVLITFFRSLAVEIIVLKVALVLEIPCKILALSFSSVLTEFSLIK